MDPASDENFMRLAIEQAMKAMALNEVPVGACLIGPAGEPLAAGFNRTITDSDPTAHAEIVALRAAASKVGNYRLAGTTMFTTVEPCVMCAGALVNARVKRLVYGTSDDRFGAAETRFRLCDSEILNHRLEITSNVLADECRRLMQEFFRARRGLGS
jgi:tRNA(adenine34) deaminase